MSQALGAVMYIYALTVQRPELALLSDIRVPTWEQLKPLCSSSVLLLLRNVSVMLTWLLAASVTAVRTCRVVLGRTGRTTGGSAKALRMEQSSEPQREMLGACDRDTLRVLHLRSLRASLRVPAQWIWSQWAPRLFVGVGWASGLGLRLARTLALNPNP